MSTLNEEQTQKANALLQAIRDELAKVTTLGERVEDMFLLQGAQLQHNKTQLAIEHELLEVLEAV